MIKGISVYITTQTILLVIPYLFNLNMPWYKTYFPTIAYISIIIINIILKRQGGTRK